MSYLRINLRKAVKQKELRNFSRGKKVILIVFWEESHLWNLKDLIQIKHQRYNKTVEDPQDLKLKINSKVIIN